MTKNIYVELELFLDPPIKKVDALEEHLYVAITDVWSKKKITEQQKYELRIAKALSYGKLNKDSANKLVSYQLIEDYRNEKLLEDQGDAARKAKKAELESEARKIITSGVTELKVKNLVTKFKDYFEKSTIEKLVPLKSSSSNQSEDEFVVPVCPDSLKCGKPVDYKVMVKISNDLREDGKKDLYDLLGVSRSNESGIPQKIKDLEKRVRDTSADNYMKNVLNRLHGYCNTYFTDKSFDKSYDVALKRFRFDEYADTTLKLYVENWKEKTNWNQYHVFIEEVKKLEYSQGEAAWLVYEYFCLASDPKRRCPPPEKPKKGAGWGEHEALRAHLDFLFSQSIRYHEESIGLGGSNPRIKNKLQSVKEQFNADTAPDCVKRTVNKMIKDLRKFWDECKYAGIVSNPLFEPAALANLPYPEIKNYLQQNFTR
jgi:hypothetical protein